MYNIKKKVKVYLKILLGIYVKIKKEIKCDYRWFGSNYGGFFVAELDLNEKSIVYSFGIGEDTSFDKAIIDAYNCAVYGFDPTPKSIKYVQQSNVSENFNFLPFGIGVKTETTRFFLPKDAEYISGSLLSNNKNVDVNCMIEVQIKSFSDIITELCHTKIDILKMDIEGAEYLVIPEILRTGIQIDQILVEFHNRFFQNGNAQTRKMVKLLKDNGYYVFAHSITFEEISFIRKNILN